LISFSKRLSHQAGRAAVVIGLIVILTAVTASLSLRLAEQFGRLSIPPTYDDVVYFTDALERLQIIHHDGAVALLGSLVQRPPHAPYSTAAALLAFLFGGVTQKGPYLVNAITIGLLLVFLLAKFRLRASMAVPLALIMLQPDLGSAMVLGAVTFGVLIAAGARGRWTLGLLLLAVLGAVLVVKGGYLASYQLERFTSFTNPTHDVQGAAYNVTQAHIAIAHGGLFGTGLFHGPQTNGGFVPEQQTDFVFSVAGEEFGLVGGSVIVALFGLLCWRGLKIAKNAEPAGQLIAVGVVCSNTVGLSMTNASKSNGCVAPPPVWS